MRITKATALLILAAGLPMLLGCGWNSLTGGTSTSENGRIAGMIIREDGSPVLSGRVTLYRATYDPIKDTAIAFRTTDSAGAYKFAKVAPGQYSVVARDRATGNLAWVTVVSAADSTALSPVGIVRRAGTIRVQLPPAADTVRGYLFIPGTPVATMLTGAHEQVTLDSVPPGKLPPLSYAETADSGYSIVRYDIEVASGDTVTVTNTAWSHAKRLFLNTTVSGAGVMGHVLRFPVLVRLTGSNFTFSEANRFGDDIRFVKADDSPLAHEIERWDPAGGRAECWVRVDTVYGNNSTQYIMMYWGNPNAGPVAPARPMFDSADGFGGVWHLSGQGDAQARDATPNGYHGAPSNVGAAEGMIGGAGKFHSGKKSYIAMQNTASGKLNFPADGNFTISTWVNSDSITYNRVILGKGDVQYYLRIHNFSWRFSEYRDLPQKGWQYTESPYTFGKWVYVCGVRKDTSEYLYADGICVDSVKTFDSDEGGRVESFNVEIGRRLLPDGSDGLYFSGTIDEARICTVARSRDWIRLNYMNQRTDDMLVRFGK
jgi:hypothetical protein